MTQPPDVLLHADYYNSFSYFAYELLASLAWASTNAGINYFHLASLQVPIDSILQREAGRYASLLWNDTHLEAPMRVLTPYQKIVINLPLDDKIQAPMPDEPPVAPPQAPIVTAFSYQRGGEPPGTYGRGYAPFAGADSAGEPSQPLTQRPPAIPSRWTLPRLPAPPKPPTPPAQWVLMQGNAAPYDNLKPKILKEVNDFKGESTDISCFFSQCEMHFSLFNQHFR